MTEDQYREAIRLRQSGLGSYAIARALGVKRSAVRYRFDHPPETRKPRNVPKSRVWGADEEANRPVVTEQEQADREQRYALTPRDLTAAFCGDPLPGYSALDRFQSVGDVALRVIDKLQTQRRDNGREG